MPRTVLIVDDSEIIRRCLRTWIASVADLEVVGEAENGAVALWKVAELHPDVVILDLQMPVMDGLEAARRIHLIAPEVDMVMVTMHIGKSKSRARPAMNRVSPFS